MKPDRIIVHTVAHDGGAMVEIQAANDDHPRVGGWLFEVDHAGNIGATFRSSKDIPMSLTIGPTGHVTVRESEDLYADSGPVLFDSEEVQ